MEHIRLGFLLIVVGMTTVFMILLIVIYLGKGLIALVNKYTPEEIIPKKPTVIQHTPTPSHLDTISNHETVAIVSSVSILTRGQGKVIKIEKNK